METTNNAPATNPLTNAATFIGRTPWGTDWYAYRPEHVEPMTKRLEAIKTRHAGGAR